MANIGKRSLQSVDLRRRAAHLARPGMEALLLAAVAIGCAQFGASILQTNSAHSAPDRSPNDANTTSVADIRSPFAPNDDGAEESNAASTLLSSVKLSGVRLAEDEAMSGAILTLESGAQRAFIVGSEIAPGMRLTEVQPDYVEIEFEGGARRLQMEAAPARFSLAKALMGEAQDAPPPPEVILTMSAAPDASPTATDSDKPV